MPLLKQIKTPLGLIRVTRDADGTLTYFQNGSYHSQANRHGTSVAPYIHVIAEILRQTHAQDILIVGCGGGTLATMLRRINRRVTVVDINPVAFAIARAYFHMPDDIRTVCHDGIAYIRTTAKRYDAVVIDVFDASNTVPRQFTWPSFYASVKKVLRPHGVMVMNMMARDDSDMRADIAAKNAAKAGLDSALYDWPHETNRNTLITANVPRTLRIPSGKEPRWIKEDLQGLIRRGIKRRVFN